MWGSAPTPGLQANSSRVPGRALVMDEHGTLRGLARGRIADRATVCDVKRTDRCHPGFAPPAFGTPSI